MPFERPSLDDLFARARSDLLAALPEAAAFRYSLASIYAQAIAGATHSLHGHCLHLATTLLPDSSDPETIARWARITATERREATAASGIIIMRGEAGAVIPEGTLLAAANQCTYRTMARVSIATETAEVRVTSEGKGAKFNRDPGSALSLINPIAGVASRAVVHMPGLSGGADLESDRELKRRYLYKLQNPPRGGHITDYIQWVEAVAGVEKAFVFRHHQKVINQVGVTFTMAGDNPVPEIGSEIVERVRGHLESLRPEAAKVTVFVPKPKMVGITLKVSPDRAEVRTAVTAELKDLFRREAGVGGAYATDGAIYLSRLREAISQAEGGHHHQLVSPSEDIVPGLYEIPVLGAIAWLS